jgi:hypothetical protein
MKKAVNSTRLIPGVNTLNRAWRNQKRDRLRKIGTGLSMKTTKNTSHAAGHLLTREHVIWDRKKAAATHVVGATLSAPIW